MAARTSGPARCNWGASRTGKRTPRGGTETEPAKPPSSPSHRNMSQQVPTLVLPSWRSAFAGHTLTPLSFRILGDFRGPTHDRSSWGGNPLQGPLPALPSHPPLGAPHSAAPFCRCRLLPGWKSRGHSRPCLQHPALCRRLKIPRVLQAPGWPLPHLSRPCPWLPSGPLPPPCALECSGSPPVPHPPSAQAQLLPVLLLKSGLPPLSERKTSGCSGPCLGHGMTLLCLFFTSTLEVALHPVWPHT
jgi:hypothetical protein